MSGKHRWEFVVAAVAGVLLAALSSRAQQPAAKSAPAKIPPVVLSKAHEALCKVKVGDAMPAIDLPSAKGDATPRLSGLLGKKATVVVFWNNRSRMAREQLADLTPDVIQPFGKSDVAVVGIAVDEPMAEAQSTIEKTGADIRHLIDADGKAFAQVGSQKLPRTYLLDPQGKILWFDIEYSLSTRRDLRQALRAVAGEPAANK